MFQTPFFSGYGESPFSCQQPQRPSYRIQQDIDPFFAPLFSRMQGGPSTRQQPRRQASTANPRRAPAPAAPLNRPQSTGNMRSPTADTRSKNTTYIGHKQLNPQPIQSSTRIPAPVKKEPQFKAYETDEAYHILGLLPEGVDKESIDLKFLDSNTLGIAGCIVTPRQLEIQDQSEDSDNQVSDIDSETDSESTTESESGRESENESEYELAVESRVESEKKWDRRNLQPYVEDVPDIDDPRTPIAIASLQMRRGSSSSSGSSASCSPCSSFPGKWTQPDNAAKFNAKIPRSKPKPTKIKKIPAQKREIREPGKKNMITNRFERTFQFPGSVEMKGIKARLEGGRIKVMVPKKRVIRSTGLPGLFWM